MPSASNRLVKVGTVSSAARMPFPSATSVAAMLSRSWLIRWVLLYVLYLHPLSSPLAVTIDRGDQECGFDLDQERDKILGVA